MIEYRPNFYVLTGASGSGKSTLIAALRARGYQCVEELGRTIVREQIDMGSDGTPWQDQSKFLTLLIARSIEAFKAVTERSRPVFFDRSIAECTGHLDLLGPQARDQCIEAAAMFRYNSTVFVSPPWPEIYANDAERRHTFVEAIASHQAELAAYVKCGYSLLEVPKAPVEVRVDFMLAHVDEEDT